MKKVQKYISFGSKKQKNGVGRHAVPAATKCTVRRCMRLCRLRHPAGMLKRQKCSREIRTALIARQSPNIAFEHSRGGKTRI